MEKKWTLRKFSENKNMSRCFTLRLGPFVEDGLLAALRSFIVPYYFYSIWSVSTKVD